MGRGGAVPKIGRTLSNEFEQFNIDNQLDASGGGDKTANEIFNSGLVTLPSEDPMEARNNIRQAIRQTTVPTAVVRGSQVSPTQMPDPTSSFDPSTLKHQQVANKLAYVPTEPQKHKHSVTCRTGVYGKSSTRVEHMGGIEIVFEVETQLATSRAMAQVRAICIMQGAIHLVPFPIWESSDAIAFHFEENSWEPIKWTKSPEVKTSPVAELDHFWRLYNQML